MSNSDDAANSIESNSDSSLSLTTIVERLKLELSLANIKLGDLKKELGQSQRRKDELLGENKDLRVQITKHREKEVALNEELLHVLMENSKLQGEIASLKKRLESVQPNTIVSRYDQQIKSKKISIVISPDPTEEKSSTQNESEEVKMSNETMNQDNDDICDTSVEAVDDSPRKGDSIEVMDMKTDTEDFGYGIKVEIEEEFENGDKERSTEVDLHHMMNPKLSPRKGFPCLFCDYVALDRKDHNYHKKVIHGFADQHYQCIQCNYVGKFANSLKKHINSVHVGVKHPCDECDKVFANAGGLYKHKNAVHRKVSHQCKLCDYQYSRSSTLKQHVDSVHKGVRYFCDKCPFSCAQTVTLKKHVELQHSSMPRLEIKVPRKKHPKSHFCEQCVFAATNSTHLKEHIAIQHEGKLYNCDQCTFVTKHRAQLKIHRKNKHEKIKHKCDQCDMTFSLIASLYRHQKQVKEKKTSHNYSCDMCGFSSCLGINRHKRREHPNIEEQLPCDECDKVFYSKAYLQVHKKTKHRMERVQCDECDQNFVSSQNLIKHKKSFHMHIKIDMHSQL